MLSVWLRCITSLCLFFTALNAKETHVAFKDVGEQITIQCRSSKPDRSLSLMKGLHEESQILHRASNGKNTIAAHFENRLEVNGEMPNTDILIKNLTSEDTGPYWCVYKSFAKSMSEEKRGTGSMLLVVRDSTQPCELTNKSLILGSVVISGAVLLLIILAFFMWYIFKSKNSRTSSPSKKPRHATTNDVYEDMRGTLRH
ncbi:uncharacterized protein si:rp71-81e14.2 isoform X2 [Scomber japonicus]|uniref:uncharacterized protein si:rp71-81e14.2 isoform X2 n=1 Tax=Scomber japonicus TaxID=13676 RepID=UPI002306A18A|nr:uncharacterized protein si:rp71-81e14.2 isoform X2 [Scomber japonicus]